MPTFYLYKMDNPMGNILLPIQSFYCEIITLYFELFMSDFTRRLNVKRVDERINCIHSFYQMKSSIFEICCYMR